MPMKPAGCSTNHNKFRERGNLTLNSRCCTPEQPTLRPAPAQQGTVDGPAASPPAGKAESPALPLTQSGAPAAFLQTGACRAVTGRFSSRSAHYGQPSEARGEMREGLVRRWLDNEMYLVHRLL